MEARLAVDDRSISLRDLDQAWSELHAIEDSGDGGALIVGLHRFQNRVAALILEKIAHLDREEGYRASGCLTMTSWLRWECHLSPRTASNELRTARRLQELPVAREAFEQGDFSLSHASILARTVDEVGNQPNPDYKGEPGEARNVEETLVESATRLNPYELWVVCKHLKLCLDPDGSLRDWERQERQQYLEASRTLDGMLHLQGLAGAGRCGGGERGAGRGDGTARAGRSPGCAGAAGGGAGGAGAEGAGPGAIADP